MIEKQDITKSEAPAEILSGVVGLSSGPILLPDDVLEKLYRSYSLKQKRSGLATFIVAAIVFDLWAILVRQGQSIESLGRQLLFWLSGKPGGYSDERRVERREREKLFVRKAHDNGDNQLYEHKFYTCFSPLSWGPDKANNLLNH